MPPGSSRLSVHKYSHSNNKSTQYKSDQVTLTSLMMQGGDTESDAAPSNNEGEMDGDEAETPEEDPEVTSLKEEIAKLESELKSKKASLSFALDQVEEYSKAGYARAVAEMENMRRVRSVSTVHCHQCDIFWYSNQHSHLTCNHRCYHQKNMNSSSKSNALASVLRDFLPVHDKMDSLKEKYTNDEFGSKYGGLSIGPTFAKMGVKEFSIAQGLQLDRIRMNVVSSEYSEALKDTVIRQVEPGMELEGNVIRAAKCVVSLGLDEDTANTKSNDEAGNT